MPGGVGGEEPRGSSLSRFERRWRSFLAHRSDRCFEEERHWHSSRSIVGSDRLFVPCPLVLRSALCGTSCVEYEGRIVHRCCVEIQPHRGCTSKPRVAQRTLGSREMTDTYPNGVQHRVTEPRCRTPLGFLLS